MPILRIENPVPDLDAWKKEGFDSDPIGRRREACAATWSCETSTISNFVMI